MTRLTRALRLALASALLAAPIGAQTGTVRIIQTNAAGDNVHIIDPTTQEVVDMILGIPMAHTYGAILQLKNTAGFNLFPPNSLPNTLFVGNPAHLAGWMCRCGVKLHFQSNRRDPVERSECENGRAKYAKTGDSIRSDETGSAEEEAV